MADKKFKILSLDGGGIRGLYSAVLLQKIQESYNIKLKDYFDLIIGTSTGSILAGAIVCDIPLNEIVKMYEEKGKLIFKKNTFRCRGLFKSKYTNKNLKNILHEIFKNIKMGDIKEPLMIVASDVTNCSVYMHKSKYLPPEEYVRDKDTKIADAILSSCSAPTFFNPLRIQNEYVLADGGLWANNPSILGLTEAITEKRFNEKIENVKILSIGTGVSKINFNVNKKLWGFLNGWENQKLIEYTLELSTQSSANMCQLILKDNYLRVSSPVNHSMDDLKGLNNLKAKANKCFLDYQEKINKFLTN